MTTSANITECNAIGTCTVALNITTELPLSPLVGTIQVNSPVANQNLNVSFSEVVTTFTVFASGSYEAYDVDVQDSIDCECPQSENIAPDRKSCHSLSEAQLGYPVFDIQVGAQASNDCTHTRIHAYCCYKLKFTTGRRYTVFSELAMRLENLSLVYKKKKHFITKLNETIDLGGGLNASLLGIQDKALPLSEYVIVVPFESEDEYFVLPKRVVNLPGEYNTSKAGWWRQDIGVVSQVWNQWPDSIRPNAEIFRSNAKIVRFDDFDPITTLGLRPKISLQTNKIVTKAILFPLTDAGFDISPALDAVKNQDFHWNNFKLAVYGDGVPSQYTTMVNHAPRLVCHSGVVICICDLNSNNQGKLLTLPSFKDKISPTEWTIKITSLRNSLTTLNLVLSQSDQVSAKILDELLLSVQTQLEDFSPVAHWLLPHEQEELYSIQSQLDTAQTTRKSKDLVVIDTHAYQSDKTEIQSYYDKTEARLQTFTGTNFQILSSVYLKEDLDSRIQWLSDNYPDSQELLRMEQSRAKLYFFAANHCRTILGQILSFSEDSNWCPRLPILKNLLSEIEEFMNKFQLLEFLKWHEATFWEMVTDDWKNARERLYDSDACVSPQPPRKESSGLTRIYPSTASPKNEQRNDQKFTQTDALDRLLRFWDTRVPKNSDCKTDQGEVIAMLLPDNYDFQLAGIDLESLKKETESLNEPRTFQRRIVEKLSKDPRLTTYPIVRAQIDGSGNLVYKTLEHHNVQEFTTTTLPSALSLHLESSNLLPDLRLSHCMVSVSQVFQNSSHMIVEVYATKNNSCRCLAEDTSLTSAELVIISTNKTNITYQHPHSAGKIVCGSFSSAWNSANAKNISTTPAASQSKSPFDKSWGHSLLDYIFSWRTIVILLVNKLLIAYLKITNHLKWWQVSLASAASLLLLDLSTLILLGLIVYWDWDKIKERSESVQGVEDAYVELKEISNKKKTIIADPEYKDGI